MPSFRASPLLRSHLFFDDDMTFHSPPHVRFAGSVEFQQFQRDMQKFITTQNKINACFDDSVLYYITSAHLNIEFCQFMQKNVSIIRAIPGIYKATLRTLEHTTELFSTHKDSMSGQLTEQILSEIKKTHGLLQ